MKQSAQSRQAGHASLSQTLPVPDASPPRTVSELLELWEQVSALRAKLVEERDHWEERLANPPPSANEAFFRSTKQLRDDAVGDLEWLDEQLEGHLKRKDPPYRLFQRWEDRRVDFRERSIREALTRTAVVLRQLHHSKRPTTPSHEDMEAAALAVLAAIQANVPVSTPAPCIQNVSDSARGYVLKSFEELTQHDDVLAACRGELDEFGGRNRSFWASPGMGAAVLLRLAGLPKDPRTLYETYASGGFASASLPGTRK